LAVAKVAVLVGGSGFDARRAVVRCGHQQLLLPPPTALFLARVEGIHEPVAAMPLLPVAAAAAAGRP